MTSFFQWIAMVVLLLALAPPADAQQLDPENTVFLDTKYGRTVIRLRPDLAPKHVERIKTLTREGFYNGVKFHRVIEGFMAQTGDPTGTGGGGSKHPDLPAEFTLTPFERGTLGMARSSAPNSANSQFFICFARTSSLNGKYTVFGEVVSGMEFIDRVRKGPQEDNGRVPDPDVVVKMQLMKDAKP
jgi:peptidylprolyl isomerase